MLHIHEDIPTKLNNFIKKKCIPNIIFYGPSGCGKRTLVNNFINKLYSNISGSKQSHVINVECGHGRGIKFIREELKFFAKTNIHNSRDIVKSIILLNAEQLTIDAQSALRRCIEVFSTTTRFFIIVNNKHNLLRPILSRFCELYIPIPSIDGIETDLHKYNVDTSINTSSFDNIRIYKLKIYMDRLDHDSSLESIVLLAEELYQDGYSAVNIMYYVEHNVSNNELDIYSQIVYFHKYKKEIRNDKLLIIWVLLFTFTRSSLSLDNILSI
jgi:DNA polymerase III delta prime subunit